MASYIPFFYVNICPEVSRPVCLGDPLDCTEASSWIDSWSAPFLTSASDKSLLTAVEVSWLDGRICHSLCYFLFISTCCHYYFLKPSWHGAPTMHSIKGNSQRKLHADLTQTDKRVHSLPRLWTRNVLYDPRCSFAACVPNAKFVCFHAESQLAPPCLWLWVSAHVWRESVSDHVVVNL